MDDFSQVIVNESEQLQPKLVKWRRDLHRLAEVGMHLPNTMRYIADCLNEMKVKYDYYEDISCIVASFGVGDHCILLRSDSDALNMVEEAEVDFKATNGCMHACGHDMHTTMLLGACSILKNHEKLLNGVVKCVFQAGEEIFQGAKALIDKGILAKPKVEKAFAMHVVSTLPKGVMVCGKQAMASVDGFKLTIKGKGGHGSMPECCIDPLNAAVQVYLGLQSLIAREIKGSDEAVLTIGQIQGGSSANIIPDEVMMQGTLRSFNMEVRNYLVPRIKEISMMIAQSYRCELTYEVLSECASVVCDDEMLILVENSIKSLYAQMNIHRGAHGMGSEDFAQISSLVPSAYYMIGAKVDETEVYGQHHPKVKFNEDVLKIGASIYAKVAFDYLK